MQTLFIPDKPKHLTARQKNIVNSPKQQGNCDIDALPYLEELKIKIFNSRQSIQFTPNMNEQIHRWAPYVQGFSASFVQSIFDQYANEYNNPVILDPFSGCGTVQVQAKLNGYSSYGTELNPLLHFIATAKLHSWDVPPDELLKIYNQLPKSIIAKAPAFLKSQKHFNPDVLRSLEILKGGINTVKNEKIKNLLKLAFSSILIDCSNLKRSPCLGYAKEKKVEATAPYALMKQKVHQIAADLELIQNEYSGKLDCPSEIFLNNAMTFQHQNRFDLIVTSPPYMNGLDYVINYKIESGWLNFADNQKKLKKLKDEMVVCDNVSKGLIKTFKPVYTNEWIDNIKINIHRRGTYRRTDMPFIVHKYFDDMYKVMENVVNVMDLKARFILVVGDSLIADVYVPTDLLLAKIGQDLGLTIEKIEKARERRSGQIRSYKLRETIITLQKNGYGKQ
ncbi:hypothetical protein FJZ31_09190 [Candidatus Poribacteria bacterium]|nr:hypothetical protein [Candidatus Poribacteria bacterium]